MHEHLLPHFRQDDGCSTMTLPHSHYGVNLLSSPRGTCLAEGVVDGRWEGDSGGMREPFSTVTAFWPLMMEFELDAGIGVAHA